MAQIENNIIKEGATNVEELCNFFGVGKRSDNIYHSEDLMLAPTIKPKSKLKPIEFNGEDVVISGVRFGKLSKLTPDQRLSVNYGHNLVVYTDATEAIRGVASGTNFPYIKPSSWFRLADLWGYNHNPSDWFELKVGSTSINVNGSTFVGINFSDFFRLGAVAEKGFTMYNINFGFLVWNSSLASQGYPQVYFISLTDLSTPGKQLIDLQDNLEIKGIPVGTWSIYPCITNVRLNQHEFTYIRGDGNYQGNWIPFPYANIITLSIVSSGGGGSVTDYINFENSYVDYSRLDNYTYVIRTITLEFSNTSTSNKEISFRLLDNNGNIQSSTGELLVSGSTVIPAESSGSVDLYYGGKEEDGIRVTVAETPLELQVQYWETGDNSYGAGFVIIG